MGAVTVIVAVAILQLGCVMLKVGAAGVVLGALITAAVAGDVQPELFLTVTL